MEPACQLKKINILNIIKIFKRENYSKNIKEIYFFKHENISLKVITDYIDNKCYSNKENDLFYILKLECFN